MLRSCEEGVGSPARALPHPGMPVAELPAVLQLLAWVFKVNWSCVIRDRDLELASS